MCEYETRLLIGSILGMIAALIEALKASAAESHRQDLASIHADIHRRMADYVIGTHIFIRWKTRDCNASFRKDMEMLVKADPESIPYVNAAVADGASIVQPELADYASCIDRLIAVCDSIVGRQNSAAAVALRDKCVPLLHQLDRNPRYYNVEWASLGEVWVVTCIWDSQKRSFVPSPVVTRAGVPIVGDVMYDTRVSWLADNRKYEVRIRHCTCMADVQFTIAHVENTDTMAVYNDATVTRITERPN